MPDNIGEVPFMPTGRRLPSRAELGAWREFIEATTQLRTAVGARLQSDTGLSAGDYAVLLALSETDDGRERSSDLAVRVGWERSRLSHHLGRMEARGLIRRERPSGIVLTPEGSAAFRDATAPHLRAVRELFVDALTPEQIEAAGEIAAALRAHLDRG